MTPQRLIARRVLFEIDKIHPSERADLYEALAIVMKPVHPHESIEAQRIADTIREAESAQLKFTALLKAADEQIS